MGDSFFFLEADRAKDRAGDTSMAQGTTNRNSVVDYPPE
jgi:hypothetical protein